MLRSSSMGTEAYPAMAVCIALPRGVSFQALASPLACPALWFAISSHGWSRCRSFEACPWSRCW